MEAALQVGKVTEAVLQAAMCQYRAGVARGMLIGLVNDSLSDWPPSLNPGRAWPSGQGHGGCTADHNRTGGTLIVLIVDRLSSRPPAALQAGPGALAKATVAATTEQGAR